MRLFLSLGTLFLLLLTGFCLILGSAFGLNLKRIQKTDTPDAACAPEDDAADRLARA